MIYVFDKFFYKSSAASAQIIRSKIENDEFQGEEVRVFCTDAQYKGTKNASFELDKYAVIQTGKLKHTNSLFMYIGLLINLYKNRKLVKEVIAMSSPGYNLYVLAIVSIFFKTRYYAQDIFPDGKLFALNLEFLKWVSWPINYLAYRNVGKLITISHSMKDYLRRTYKRNADVIRNPSSLMSSRSKKNYEKSNVFFFSGNFSYAHGYNLPISVFKKITSLNYILKVHGFGKNFDKMQNSGEFTQDVFGGFLSESEYQDMIGKARVFVIAQDYGYERFCYTSKFTSLFGVEGSRFLYIGPKCDISEILTETGRGVHITKDDDDQTITQKLMQLIDE